MKKPVVPPISEKELEEAKVLAQLLMLKAFHYGIPQTLRIEAEGESFEVTFTRGNTRHLMPSHIQRLYPKPEK